MGARKLPVPIPAVPTLTLERDPLPSSCAHCGSRGLTRIPPTGRDSTWTLSCLMCGSVAAYLEPSLPRLPAAPTDAAPDPTEAWRRPDCGTGCARLRVLPLVGFGARRGPLWLVQHDVDAHLHHEAALTVALAVALAAPPLPADATIRTGSLAVDLAGGRCMVDGREVWPSELDLAILGHLGRRLGRLCTTDEILADVWLAGDTFKTGRRRGDRWEPDHVFRTALTRLRGKLGPARDLIANRFGFGYTLLDAPYVGPAAFPDPRACRRTGGRWAIRHDACVICGTTASVHVGRGRCAACASRARRLERE